MTFQSISGIPHLGELRCCCAASVWRAGPDAGADAGLRDGDCAEVAVTAPRPAAAPRPRARVTRTPPAARRPPPTDGAGDRGQERQIRRSAPQHRRRRRQPTISKSIIQAIEALPQGANTTLDKVLLQAPGVSQDLAASGELHVRNEHANVQYRINGIMLPDGVGGFGQFLDTGIVGSIDADRPVRCRRNTASHRRRTRYPDQDRCLQQQRQRQRLWRQPRHHHAELRIWRHRRQTQYFVSGRYFGSNLGLENPTPGDEAIHDCTSQEKGFLYLSTVLDPTPAG